MSGPAKRRGRPPCPARAAAKAAGLQAYQGRPCKYGHNGARYTSTAVCITCAGASPAARAGRAAGLAAALID